MPVLFIISFYESEFEGGLKLLVFSSFNLLLLIRSYGSGSTGRRSGTRTLVV